MHQAVKEHPDKPKIEFWFARDLQEPLGYARWENFLTAIQRAIGSCESTGYEPEHHFRGVTKLITHGKGASGMRKLMRYGKHYGGSDPRLIEGDVFRIEIAVPAGKTSEKGSEKGSEKSSEKIIQLLRSEPEKSAAELAEVIGISSRAVEKQIAKLRDEGRLRRIGPDKGGHWEVLN